MPRILVVDDEPALRRTYERALSPRGFEVNTVGDPHLAYELLESAEHDLVLLDIHLPGLPGDALYLALARRWPGLANRVVLMTGDPNALDPDWPDELRRRPVLLKPFSLDALHDAVVEALAQAEANEPQRKRNGG
jgi:two-component system KDP operon response regulator KdpE